MHASVAAMPAPRLSRLVLALLPACGDAGGGSADAAASSGEAGSQGPTATSAPEPPTSSATGDSGGDATAASVTGGPGPSTGDPATTEPATTSTTTTGTTGATTDASSGDDSTTGAPVDPGGCVTSVDGWCWTTPLPHGNRLYDIWDDGQGKVWVAGEGGTLMFHDGQQWTTTPAAHAEDFRGIWGAAPDDIWAVGGRGKIVHWDGATWSEVASGTTRWLKAVHGFASDDVYAVGNQKTVIHWDGEAWSPVAWNFGGDQLSIWGTAGNDVWIGGSGFGGPVAHYDGVAWGWRSVDGPGGVAAMWGTGPQDVYAARDNGKPFLNHWTGDPIWDEVDTPFGTPLYAVVGDGERLYAGGRGALLELENGAYTENDDFLYTETQALAVVGDEVLAVGERGSIARRSAGAWAFEHGDAGKNRHGFDAIAGNGPDDIWAAAAQTAHWDGEKWTFVDIGQGAQSFVDMSAAGGAIWGLTWNGDHWLWRCKDGVWTEEAKLTSWGAWELWAQDADTVWVAIQYVNVSIARWDGQTMMEWDLGADAGDIHGLAPDDIWAVGDNETLWHFDGLDWAKIRSTPNGEDTDQIWVVGPDDVWAAGTFSGFAFHWDGVNWTDHDVSKWGGSTDLWGSGPDDLFTVSGTDQSPGFIHHWDGQTWSPMISGQGPGLAAIWGIDKDVWIVGFKSSALVLRR